MRRALLLLALLANPLAACRTGGQPESSLAGYVTNDSRTLWRIRKIPVCWENGSPSTASGQEVVRKAVEQEYNARTEFEFVGWGACAPDSQGVRIKIHDGNSIVSGFGAFVDGVPAGMRLNFGDQGGLYPKCVSSEAFRANCIATAALHEFGHVLGLRHEMNRPDGTCKAYDQTGGFGEYLGLPLGPYDSDSIMNYCVVVESYNSGKKAHLSDGDLATITSYYGPDISLATASQSCAQRWGTWDSFNSCCNIVPSHYDFLVPYLPCNPAQQCLYDFGEVDGNCCRIPFVRPGRIYAKCIN